jgi:hypothetical protein
MGDMLRFRGGRAKARRSDIRTDTNHGARRSDIGEGENRVARSSDIDEGVNRGGGLNPAVTIWALISMMEFLV